MSSYDVWRGGVEAGTVVRTRVSHSPGKSGTATTTSTSTPAGELAVYASQSSVRFRVRSPASPSPGPGPALTITRREEEAPASPGSDRAETRPPHHSHAVVVAIDFGTTYSGYAYSLPEDPDNIHVMRKWEGDDPGINNQKTPTVLLLTPDGEFHSFGFTARDFYHDLETREAKRWLYFDKFKMLLHHNKASNRGGPGTSKEIVNVRNIYEISGSYFEAGRNDVKVKGVW